LQYFIIIFKAPVFFFGAAQFVLNLYNYQYDYKLWLLSLLLNTNMRQNKKLYCCNISL